MMNYTMNISRAVTGGFELTLPRMQGSQKQVKWADDIRYGFLALLANYEDLREEYSGKWESSADFGNAIQRMLNTYPVAKNWIEQMNNKTISEAIDKVMEFYVEGGEVNNPAKGLVTELIALRRTAPGTVEVTFKKNKTGKTLTSLRKELDSKAYPDKKKVTIESDVYIFDYEGDIGKNIKWLENYKENVKGMQEPIEEGKPVEVEVEKGDIVHESFNKIIACVSQDIPVYLVGPAGSGKNHTLEQVARNLGLNFYFTNSIQQEHKLTGFIDAGGRYHETEFYKAFTNGGLFFLDEMDASIPEVLVLLNAAIANGYFEFPNGRAEAHIDFRVVAAGNTMGSGADEQYTGRLVLDQATLDRFVIIEFGYDIRIEMKLAKGNLDLVSFIRDLREQSQKLGIRATYSYRCIMAATKLNGILSIEEIITIAIVKGIDKETVKTYNADENNIYGRALKQIQRAA